ncbi:enterobactin synthetase component D [Pseudomonas duriflava]|uniref:Enterobactin synthase component D n=1 Tax=Pseudomonas duriflava TaxID=459528 RepID=A0A562QAI6_9PSED|nr:4'-phosphopantetheinyl transferase superfamily protein [Pseudomonas duriflava]TWI53775.1 enterobactin synthetase component D [Pseudomonas duriflava]
MTFIPAYCTPLDASWPFPVRLSDVALYSVGFDPTRLVDSDFMNSGIEPPPTLQRAVPKRRSEFLAGRLCARTALHALTGEPHVPEIGEDRAPRWPRGTCGSITHSAGWAAALAARTKHWQSIGMDTEILLSSERSLRLTDEILTPSEKTLQHEASDPYWVTLAFSLKESLFKALYPLTGVRFYFQDAEIIHWTPDGVARLRLRTSLSTQWSAGCELEAWHVLQDNRIISLIAVPA